jgi:hypothetical protein
MLIAGVKLKVIYRMAKVKSNYETSGILLFLRGRKKVARAVTQRPKEKKSK